MAEGRALDVVLLGATGFTGRLVADHLARRAPAELRVGLAGRSEGRLAAVRASLGASAAGWPLVTADLADAASLERLAGAAPIVVSTAGPYAPAGMALVEACAAAGTDYLDLCGEVLFMRDSIDRCHDAAVASGARVVHACGFDSIPSDLGVLLLHEAARADGAGSLESTTLVVTAAKGGLSGGTLAAMKGELDAVRASPERRRIVADPYALSPRREAEPELGGERDLRGVERDERLGVWLGPFVMASINTRVVRRSNALQDHAYGRRFAYREATGYGGGRLAPLRAGAVAAGTAALLAALSHPAGRGLLDRLLPAPGEGPDAAARGRPVPVRDPHDHVERRALPLPGRRRRGPRLRRDRGDAGRERALPRPRPRAAAGTRRRAHARGGDGRRARRPAAGGGAQLRGRARRLSRRHARPPPRWPGSRAAQI